MTEGLLHFGQILIKMLHFMFFNENVSQIKQKMWQLDMFFISRCHRFMSWWIYRFKSESALKQIFLTLELWIFKISRIFQTVFWKSFENHRLEETNDLLQNCTEPLSNKPAYIFDYRQKFEKLKLKLMFFFSPKSTNHSALYNETRNFSLNGP